MTHTFMARLAILGSVSVSVFLMATAPVFAEVPEGDNVATDVDFFDGLGIFVAAPLALILLISLIAYSPVLIKRQRDKQRAESELAARPALGSGEASAEITA